MYKKLTQVLLILILAISIVPAFSQENNIVIKSISSSGFLPPDKLNSYYPLNLIDEKPNTMWAESNPEDGLGEFIKIEFLNSQSIDQIEILNGYNNPDYFLKNNRVSLIEIDINGEFYLLRSLEDTPNKQVIKFPRSEFIREIKLIICGVYRGEKWNDTCISEIGFSNKGLQLKKTLAKDYADYYKTNEYTKSIEHFYDTNAIEYKRITDQYKNNSLVKQITEDRARSYWKRYNYENGILASYSETEADKCPGNQGEFKIAYKDGRIDKIIETRNFEEDDENPIIHMYTYSEYGVKEIKTTQKGKIVSLETYTYNRNGEVLKKEVTYEGEKPVITSYFYLDKKLIKTETKKEGKSTAVTTYQYNGDRLIRKIGLTNHGNEGSIEYYYNAKGKASYQLSISSNEKPECVDSFSYNSNGDLIGMISFDFWYYSD